MKKTFGFLALVCLAAAGCHKQPSSTSASIDNKPISAAKTEVVAEANDIAPAGRFVRTQVATATLKAKFVYGGKAPEAAKIDGSKDPFCGNLNIVSEAMVIGKDGEIQNLALILDARRSKVDIPKDMLQAAPAKFILDNKGCMFVPHVLFARPGQTINVVNSDQTGHNANFNFFNNAPVNFLVPGGGNKELELKADEPAPIPVECNVHPWMKSYLIVQEHPYVGISDDKGEIMIENLPVGAVTFKVWHENAEKSIDEAEVNGKKEKWSRGRMEIELKAGMNDLGTITIAPNMFKQ